MKFFSGLRKNAASEPMGAVAYMPGGAFDLVLSSTFVNILALAMPLVLLQVYDRIIPNTALETLILLIGGVGTAFLLEALLRMGRSYVSGWMGARFEHLAGCSAMERLLSANIVDFERQGSGVHLERMNSLATLKEFYAGQAIQALCDLPFAILYLGALAYLAGSLVASCVTEPPQPASASAATQSQRRRRSMSPPRDHGHRKPRALAQAQRATADHAKPFRLSRASTTGMDGIGDLHTRPCRTSRTPWGRVPVLSPSWRRETCSTAAPIALS